MAADKKNNDQQILQAVFDVPKQALKVDLPGPIEVEFSGGTQEVEIDALDGDNIALADPITGNLAEIVNRKLKVDVGDVDITGEVTATIPPSTDYSVKTLTATGSYQQLTFGDLTTVSSVAIKLLGTSTDNLLIAKTSTPAGTDFGTFEPGDATTLPVYQGAQIWYKASTGVGTATFTAFAAN